MKPKGIITLVYGSDPAYLEMAKTLAMSLDLTNPHLPRAVVTDRPAEELNKYFQEVIRNFSKSP